MDGSTDGPSSGLAGVDAGFGALVKMLSDKCIIFSPCMAPGGPPGS